MERYGTKQFGFVATCVALEKLRNVFFLQRMSLILYLKNVRLVLDNTTHYISLKNHCFIVYPLSTLFYITI